MKISEFQGERGSVLIVTLGILTLVNVLLWVILQTVVIDRKITYNVTQNQQAIFATDAGLKLVEQAMLQAVETADLTELNSLYGEFSLPGVEDTFFSLMNGELLPGDHGSFQYQIECLGVAKRARHKIMASFFYDAVTGTVTLISYEDT